MHRIIEEDCERIVRELDGGLAKLSGQTALVTGFAGFLGSYLTNVLLHANRTALRGKECKFIGLDNFSRGKPDWVSEIEKAPGVEILKYDASGLLPRELENREIGCIIHAASIASPTYYRLHPLETMDANVEGLRNLLCYSLKHKSAVKSILFFSSSEVYGDPAPENIPTQETYRGNVSFTGPRACYDESKRYGETLCANYFRAHGLPIKTARPFNNYGPGLKITDKRVIPDFFRNIFAGKDLAIFSDGKPTRTFCYVADAVSGYFKILLSEHNGEAFNIGMQSPETSISELAEKVVKISREVLGMDAKVEYEKNPEADYLSDSPSRRAPDISKAKKLLGFDPKTTLDEGLKRTALWYKDNHGGTEN